MIQLKDLRKQKKVTIKQIGLNSRTVAKIEAGDDSVSVKALKVYLEAIDLQLVYAFK